MVSTFESKGLPHALIKSPHHIKVEHLCSKDVKALINAQVHIPVTEKSTALFKMHTFIFGGLVRFFCTAICALCLSDNE